MFWRALLANGVPLAMAVAILSLTPATVSYPITGIEALTLIGGLAVTYAVNWVLTRRILRPLEELQTSIESVEVPGAQGRISPGDVPEVARLAASYNAMLDRLDRERRRSVGQAVAAQEDERARVSSELHDEVGQTLTALILRLSLVEQQASTELAPQITECKEAVRLALAEVRGISSRLRPGSLRDLGLLAALRGLATEISNAGGPRVQLTLPEATDLSEELELVIYRIAQESLTNVVRHSGAERAWLELVSHRSGIVLRIRDDGNGRQGTPGTGLVGMAERARLTGGSLDIRAEPGRGTMVEFRVAATERVSR